MKINLPLKSMLFGFGFVCMFLSNRSWGQMIPDPVPPNPTGPQTETIYDVVDESAEYPGGAQALFQFIKDNLVYPTVAFEAGIQGKTYLKLTISDSGMIRSVFVMKGVADCPECDKEAVRVAKLMPKWKPAKVNGKNVSSYYRIPVTFRIQ